jgi:hypothetical protein
VGGYQNQEQTTDPPESVGRFLGSRGTVLRKSKKIGSRQGIVTAALQNWERIRKPPVLINALFRRRVFETLLESSGEPAEDIRF